MQETGYETFSFYYDALTENVNYPARAAYLDGLVQKYNCLLYTSDAADE